MAAAAASRVGLHNLNCDLLARILSMVCEDAPWDGRLHYQAEALLPLRTLSRTFRAAVDCSIHEFGIVIRSWDLPEQRRVSHLLHDLFRRWPRLSAVSITYWRPRNVLLSVLPLLAAECPGLRTLTLDAGSSLPQDIEVVSLLLPALSSLSALQTLCLTRLSQELFANIRGLSSLTFLKVLRMSSKSSLATWHHNPTVLEPLGALEELCITFEDHHNGPLARVWAVDLRNLALSPRLSRLDLELVAVVGESLLLKDNKALTSLRLQTVQVSRLVQLPAALRDIELENAHLPIFGRSLFEAEGELSDLTSVVMTDVLLPSAMSLLAASSNITSLTLKKPEKTQLPVNLVATIVASLPALVSLVLEEIKLCGPLPDLARLLHLRHLQICRATVPSLQWLQNLELLHTLVLKSIDSPDPSSSGPPLDIGRLSSLRALTLLQSPCVNTKRLSLLTGLCELLWDLPSEPEPELSTLTRLSTLELHGAGDSEPPQGLAGLPSLPNLKHLTLVATKVDLNLALGYVKQVPSLTLLHLRAGPRLASLCLESFCALRKLVLEDLFFESLLDMHSLPSLTAVTLERVEFLSGLVTLRNLPRLECVLLSQT